MVQPRGVGARARSTRAGRPMGLTGQRQDTADSPRHGGGHERRVDVYRADAQFAPPDPPCVAPRGTPERAELARRACELRVQGKPYLHIAIELGVSDKSARVLCAEHQSQVAPEASVAG